MFYVSDLVPVCDHPNEAGVSGGEQPTAAASTLPEGKAGQEEHSTMRRLRCRQTTQDCFYRFCKDVFMYIVYLLSLFVHHSCIPQSLFATLSQRKKEEEEKNSDF